MFFFVDYSDPSNLVIETTDDDNYIKMYLCIQEILFRKGESQFDVDLGIDYDAIFSQSTFISTQLEEIIEKYKPYFRSIDYNITQEKEKVFVNIEFSFNFENSPSLGGTISIKSGSKLQSRSKSFRLALSGDRRVDVYN